MIPCGMGGGGGGYETGKETLKNSWEWKRYAGISSVAQFDVGKIVYSNFFFRSRRCEYKVHG